MSELNSWSSLTNTGGAEMFLTYSYLAQKTVMSSCKPFAWFNFQNVVFQKIKDKDLDSEPEVFFRHLIPVEENDQVVTHLVLFKVTRCQNSVLVSFRESTVVKRERIQPLPVRFPHEYYRSNQIAVAN